MNCNTDRRTASRSWVLPQGQALTFTPTTAGVLRVPCGRAWVTLSRRPQRSATVAPPAPMEDDVFLDPNTSLPLRAGETIVLESWPDAPATGLRLVWEAAVLRPGVQQWQQTVAQPARELAQGLLQAGHGFASMLRGLWGYAAW